ncbi:MAG: cell division protein ZapA [Bacteroides sp.]|nr:cell division protein ZapA [Bacteroides sp.]MBD5271450.1 cell division protein ZapA [Bacteroides sp.]MBD5332962.1 cell division protein ZapA [Bacteroides sp.]
MTDKQLNITIRIADLPRIPLSIPASREELVRRAEENINILWNRWKEREEFKDKSSAEILAMVTFRFAQLYYANLDASENLMQTLADLEANFDRLLLRDVVS